MKQFLPLLLLIFLFSCSTQKEIYIDNPHTLRFGSAGGFTNQTTVYKLLSDGSLSKTDGLTKETTLLKQLRKSQTKKVFKQAYQVGIDTLKLDKPGNISNFIQLKTKSVDNKIIWYKDSDQTPEEITTFYKNLIQLTTTK